MKNDPPHLAAIIANQVRRAYPYAGEGGVWFWLEGHYLRTHSMYIIVRRTSEIFSVSTPANDP